MMFNILNFTITVNKMNDDQKCFHEMETKRIQGEMDQVKDKYIYDSYFYFLR